MATNLESYEQERLHTMSTRELVRHVIDEARIVARAEALHAKAELELELKRARMAAIFLVPAAVLALCALVLGLAVVGFALPVVNVGAFAIVGGFCLIVAVWLGLAGWMKLPKKPMHRTRSRLEHWVEITKEELH